MSWDKLTTSTIMLTLYKSVYFNVKEINTTYQLWEKLYDLYELKSAMSPIYWFTHLVDLKMKDFTTMSIYFNDGIE